MMATGSKDALWIFAASLLSLGLVCYAPAASAAAWVQCASPSIIENYGSSGWSCCPGGSLSSCTHATPNYFQDIGQFSSWGWYQTSSCSYLKGDVCQSSAFASGCTADAECNGVTSNSESTSCSFGVPNRVDFCSSACKVSDSSCESSCPGYASSGGGATCDEKSPGSDGTSDWECSDAAGTPSSTANQQCWCEASCGVAYDACEENFGADAACDELSVGATCGTNKRCSSTCGCVSSSCTDTDNGDYPKTAGTVTVSGTPYQDSCSAATLTEQYCDGAVRGSKTYNCNDYDCDTGLSCTSSGASLTLSGDDYSCLDTNPDYCGSVGTKTCGTYTCGSSNECSATTCAATSYKCYYSNAGSYAWSTSYPASETACSDGHDNDCDGRVDCVLGNEDPDCNCPSACNLLSASITANCAGGASADCEAGETVTMSGTYTGDCSAADFFQIDARSADATCDIQYAGGDMSGIWDSSITVSGGTVSNAVWTIPAITTDCSGKTVSATAAALYDGGAPGAGTWIDGAESVSGSFKFVADNPPTCSVSSITESSIYAYSSGTTLWYNTASTGSFTVTATATDDIGISKVSFPTTVSTGGDDTTSPYSWAYNWDTADTYSSAATVTAYDTIGQTGTCAFTVTRDITAPTTAASITGSYTVTLTCSDTQSGCYQTKYCTDTTNTCTPTTTYTSPFAQSCTGCCYVRYYSMDNVNNQETTKSTSFGPTCECTRANPAVSISPASQSATAGSTLTYTVSVINYDNAACGSSAFSLTRTCPSGWTCSLSPTSLTISPGSSNTSTFSVTSSSSAAAGDYTVSVTATNNGATSYNGTGSATYTVTTGDGDGGGTPFTLVMKPGWNLISMPYSYVDSVTSDTCGAAEGNFYFYNATTGKWNVQTVGIAHLKKATSYWFYSGSYCSVTVQASGDVAESDVVLTKNEWNDVGSPKNGMNHGQLQNAMCRNCANSKCSSMEVMYYDTAARQFKPAATLEEGVGYKIMCIGS